MDEREKFRKFRELDDAFAEALRGMEGDSRRQQRDERKEFEQRLRTLMNDYSQSDASVDTLLRTLLGFGRIACSGGAPAWPVAPHPRHCR